MLSQLHDEMYIYIYHQFWSLSCTLETCVQMPNLYLCLKAQYTSLTVSNRSCAIFLVIKPTFATPRTKVVMPYNKMGNLSPISSYYYLYLRLTLLFTTWLSLSEIVLFLYTLVIHIIFIHFWIICSFLRLYLFIYSKERDHVGTREKERRRERAHKQE